MSKNLIIPDVHGRKFWRKALELVDSVDRVIFLGDYHDPYPHENISKESSIYEVKSILEFKLSHPSKVVLLLGNHDCHYMWDDLLGCSRFDGLNYDELSKLFNDNKLLFNILYKTDNILFSHAGVVYSWIKKYCKNKSIDELLDKPIDYFHDKLWIISYMRGGWEDFGSCVWSDVREFKNELDYYQVFGHTQLKDELICKTFACLDSRKCFLMDTETKEITSIENENEKIY
jgi:hypothetical protein